jgi:hypothetical protein
MKKQMRNKRDSCPRDFMRALLSSGNNLMTRDPRSHSARLGPPEPTLGPAGA